MEFGGTFEQTQTLAGDVVARLISLGLRQTPPNFTIFYTYLTGRYPDLIRAVDDLLAEKETISEADCAALYETYFAAAKQDEVFKAAGERMEKALNQVVELLATAGGDADEYGRSLAGLGDALQDANAIDQVRSVVKQIIVANQHMQSRTTRLERRLEDSSEQVKLLRQDLEDSRREASTDGLTGIANRMHFDRCLREEAAGAIEHGTPASLLLLDIDKFKNFNDAHGHQLGDEVLKLVAHELRNNIKGRDTAARYGGEEFAIILPLTDLDNAATVAEHIRDSVARRKIIKRGSGETLGNITLSVGVAGYRAGEPLADLIQRADEALYIAKRAGRNRIAREFAPKEALTAGE